MSGVNSYGATVQAQGAALSGGPGCVDYWVVSARELPLGVTTTQAMERLVVWHREPSGWVRYSCPAFITALNSDVPVTFYVHGIFATAESSTAHSKKLFTEVAAGTPPFRGVLWLWPSDYQYGVSPREQVDRALVHGRVQACCLATILGSTDCTATVNLIGHSLGCEIIAAALHKLATGNIARQELIEPAVIRPRQIQAVLLAPTIGPHSLSPGGEYSAALGQVDRLVVTYNRDDLALAAYEEIRQRASLGLVGLPLPTQPQPRPKLLQVNARPAVGIRHSPSLYFDSPLITEWLRGFVSEAPPRT